MKKTALIMPIILCVSTVMAAGSAFAQAKLQIYPTQVVIADGETSSYVNVINGGGATGRYRASFVDLQMPEDGALSPLPEGQKGPYSAQDFVRISPMSVTVPPGQSQKYRLLARIPRDLPDGEYRSHLNVLMASNDVVADAKPQQGVAMKIQPRLRLSVPVVVFKGQTSFTAALDSLTVEPNSSGSSSVAKIGITAEGNRSAVGKMVVTLDQSGKTHELFSKDVTVYRGVPRRVYRATLTLPAGVALSGVLTARYVGEDGKLISEKSINL